jgi:glycosyltransferase involved in cell wall biosynthesis
VEGKTLESLRIALLVHHFPPRPVGGAGWRAFRTARWLQRAGHEVRVVCVDSITCGDSHSLAFTDDEYEGIPTRRLCFDLPDKHRLHPWEYRNTLIGNHLSEYLQVLKPDVVHLISGYLMSGAVIEAAKQNHVPIVASLTDFWFFCPRINLRRSDGKLCPSPDSTLRCLLCLSKERRRYRYLDAATGGLFGRLLLWAWRWPFVLRMMDLTRHEAILRERQNYLMQMLNMVDIAIAPSQFLRSFFITRGVKPTRWIFCRQGLDLASWGEIPSKVPAPFLRVGYIGQIAKHKGVDILVKAFKCVRADNGALPRLKVYGDIGQFPDFARKLCRLAADADHITLEGVFKNEDIAQIHAGLDVLIVPSVWYENSPNVILEAFATGTPVIASRLGGMAELVQHETNGLLFAPGDAVDLECQLQRLVDDTELLPRLRTGIVAVKGIEKEMQELVQIYREVSSR